MSKKIKKYLTIILIVLIVLLIVFLYFKSKSGKKEEPKEEVKEVDVIKTNDFDYILYDNKSDLYKEYFNKLKEELSKEPVNDLEYAKLVGELFVIDFYSLKDKKTSTDVGGLDFVLESIKENFILKATDTMYKYVESNVYGDRKQELPSVKSIEIVNFDTKSVKTDDLNDENGYSGTIKLTYEKEMGYPKEVNLTFVHSDKKIYVVEVK